MKRQILFWLFLVSLIIFRFWMTRPVYKDGQKLRIASVIFSDPAKYSSQQKITVSGIKITLPRYPEINYGDKIVVEGEVSGNEIKKGSIISVSESQGIFPILRKDLVNFYQNVLPEPHSSLVSGITLGAKASLPPDFWNNLKRTSTAHVVVASGMNVTLVAGFLISFLAVIFPRKLGIIFALAGIFAYVAISGFDAPIIRAAIMGSLTFFAQETGRVVSTVRVLIISALVMLIVRPDWIGDIGFILSFTATASLILFEKTVRKFIDSKISFLPEFLKSDFSTTLAAQIGVSPILFVTFGQFNILSPVINALILWTVPFIMIIGAIGGGVGLLIPILGKLILYLIYPLTLWFVSVVSFFNF